MMKNNVKKNSVAKKLVPAAGMLALSASMLATSTYAWFTMNKEVTVTGMTVHTAVGSNLLISEDNSSTSSYRNELNQVRNCLLEPSSSIDAINYYYTSTSNVDAAGDALSDTYVAYSESTDLSNSNAEKTKYDTGFQTNYGITGTIDTTNVAYGYVDYSFYLKAVNTNTEPKNIKLTKLNLLNDNGAITDKAWRAALIVQNATVGTPLNTALASTDVISIYTISGAANHTGPASGDDTVKDFAVADTQDRATADPATTAVRDLKYGANSDITSYNQAGNFANINSGADACYKVTIRLWLEGEDTSCTNDTYALLKGDYMLDLKFCMDDTDAAVTNIGSAPNTTITGSGTTRTAALLNGDGQVLKGKTAASYQWYNATTGAAITENGTAASYTGTAGDKVYCIITTERGTTYRTATATLEST